MCSYRALFFIAALLSLVIGTVGTSAAAGTKVIHSWVVTGPMPMLRRILVVAALDNYLIRQHLEDEMESLLSMYGVDGVRGHMVLPPRNELMEGELKQRIKDSDLEGVLIIRLKDIRDETKEFVSPYVPPIGYYRLDPFLATQIRTFEAQGYSETFTVARAESNLYDAQTERLVWSGETDTVYSKDFQKLAKEYAKALVKRLKKDKVIVEN
jgi:hypothetical protein